MQIHEIPTINPNVFAFRLLFPGLNGDVPGDRHFLEHMLIKTNEKFEHDTLRKELSKLGGLRAFRMDTLMDQLWLSGNLNVKQRPKMIELLNAILNDASFLEEEFENEKHVVKQELHLHENEESIILMEAIGDLIGIPLSVGGHVEDIDAMTREHLIELYYSLITKENAVLFVHNPGEDLSRLEIKTGAKPPEIPSLRYEGEELIDISDRNISSSGVLTFYHQSPSIASYALKDYLNEMEAPLFQKLRQEKGYCYKVDASQTFAIMNHSFKQFNIECWSKLEPRDNLNFNPHKYLHQIADELEECFVVDNSAIYENVLNYSEQLKEEARMNMELRFQFAYTEHLLGCSFDQLRNKPSWDEFKEFAQEVKRSKCGTIFLKA